jgi:hypothetical protein
LPTQGLLVARFARIVLTIALAVAFLLVGLLLLERSGSNPVAPLGQNISSLQPAAPGAVGPQNGSGDNSDNPNRHCKPAGFPGCRPPSGS